MKELVRRLQKDGEVSVSSKDMVSKVINNAKAYDKKWNVTGVNYGYVQAFRDVYIIKQLCY